MSLQHLRCPPTYPTHPDILLEAYSLEEKAPGSTPVCAPCLLPLPEAPRELIWAIKLAREKKKEPSTNGAIYDVSDQPVGAAMSPTPHGQR